LGENINYTNRKTTPQKNEFMKESNYGSSGKKSYMERCTLPKLNLTVSLHLQNNLDNFQREAEGLMTRGRTLRVKRYSAQEQRRLHLLRLE
jgi:hypothetical protein